MRRLPWLCIGEARLKSGDSYGKTPLVCTLVVELPTWTETKRLDSQSGIRNIRLSSYCREKALLASNSSSDRLLRAHP